MGFRGEYEVTMDIKGRFLLPAAVKKQVPEENATMFVVTRGFENCLALYPKNTWESIVASFSKLNDLDDKVRLFRRFFINGATDVELDNAGRLLLPKGFIEYGGLNKEMVLSGAGKKMEIWDKSKYKEFFENISQEQFKDVANDVKQKMEGLNLEQFFI
jgi:MraZ protein